MNKRDRAPFAGLYPLLESGVLFEGLLKRCEGEVFRGFAFFV
jgi:hypothetical protein